MSPSEYQELIEFLGHHFEAIDQRFETIDQRFVAIDQQFVAVFRRFDGWIGVSRRCRDRSTGTTGKRSATSMRCTGVWSASDQEYVAVTQALRRLER